MTSLDDIAEQIVERLTGCHYPDDIDFARSAIDKALEAVLTREPSDETLLAGYKAYGNERDMEGIMDAYRAMTAALLEELKGKP